MLECEYATFLDSFSSPCGPFTKSVATSRLISHSMNNFLMYPIDRVDINNNIDINRLMPSRLIFKCRRIANNLRYGALH